MDQQAKQKNGLESDQESNFKKRIRIRIGSQILKNGSESDQESNF